MYIFGYVYMVITGIVLSLNYSIVAYELRKSGIKAYRKHIYYKKWGDHYKKVIFNMVMEKDKQRKKKEENAMLQQKVKIGADE